MKALPAKCQLKMKKVLVIMVTWSAIGVGITLYDHLAFNSQFSTGTSPTYSFLKSLFINAVGGLVGALLGGSFLVFYVDKRFREEPYWKTILLVAFSFVVVITWVTVLLALFLAYRQTGQSLMHPSTQTAVNAFLVDPLFLKNLLVWAVIVTSTQLMLHVNDKFGQGILWKFIQGRYHTPKEETRIFMFVDLLASTTLAEKLSHKEYYHLLRDFYADITNPILYNKGEIYQYVGDEIVISWRLHEGLANSQCLKCYFDMRNALSELKQKYQSKYGLVPDFKAGLHYGKVIAGEIGIVKRDITFSGDVLNTTSRIQGKCNEYNVKILISDELLQQLPCVVQYQRIPMGAAELKGKEAKVAISTLRVSID